MGKHIASPPAVRVKRRSAIQTVALVCVTGFLLVAAVVAGLALFTHASIESILLRPIAAPPQQVFGKNNILLLIEGLDYDYTQTDQEYSTHSRSDVIWAVNLDFAHGKVYQLSVPRDMDAVLPNGHESKINQAQSDGGIKEAQSVIAQFLGIPSFDRYVIFRINTAKDLINALGGVEVNVQNSDPTDKSRMIYDDNWGHLHINLKPGFQHLNGIQAVGYMRFRHDFCGDPCRIKRQQQVLKALVSKVRSNKINTVIHAADLIGVFNKDVITNLNSNEEISIAMAMQSLQPSDVKTAQVPYFGTKDLGDWGEVLVPDEAAKNKLVANLLIAPPQPKPAASAIAQVAAPSVKVDVENGAGIPGLAKRVAAALRAKGFAVGHVGNAAGSFDTTQVHTHSGIPLAGEKVRQALGALKITLVSDATTSSQASDVTVIVGRDLATYGPEASAAQ